MCCTWRSFFAPRDVLRRSGSFLQPCAPGWSTQRLVETLPQWLGMFTPGSWEGMGRFQDCRSCQLSCWICRVRILQGKSAAAAPTRPWAHEVSWPEWWCPPAETQQVPQSQGRSKTAPEEHRDNWIWCSIPRKKQQHSLWKIFTGTPNACYSSQSVPPTPHTLCMTFISYRWNFWMV